MEFLTATAPVIFGLMDAKFGRRRRRDVKFGGFSVKLGAASVKFYLAEAALCGTIKEWCIRRILKRKGETIFVLRWDLR